jgi:hypothetical protein
VRSYKHLGVALSNERMSRNATDHESNTLPLSSLAYFQARIVPPQLVD